jgi:hypothetical protein
VHGIVEAKLVLITRSHNDLDVFLSTSIPIVVECFQVLLERSATSSPRCGVKDHDEFEAFNALLA